MDKFDRNIMPLLLGEGKVLVMHGFGAVFEHFEVVVAVFFGALAQGSGFGRFAAFDGAADSEAAAIFGAPIDSENFAVIIFNHGNNLVMPLILFEISGIVADHDRIDDVDDR